MGRKKDRSARHALGNARKAGVSGAPKKGLAARIGPPLPDPFVLIPGFGNPDYIARPARKLLRLGSTRPASGYISGLVAL